MLECSFVRPLAATLALAVSLAAPAIAAPVTPPEQPASGPGGREYAFARVAHHTYGQGAEQYWIFEPQRPTSAHAPSDLPAVVFLHGWGAMNPLYYGAWIEHLVKRGHTVIYPRYQESLRTPPAEMTGHALAAVRDARAHARNVDAWVVIGHSMGGVLAANVAARAAQSDVSAPLAVLSVEPGSTQTRSSRELVPLDDLGALPHDMLLVTVAGDRDTVFFDRDARLIFERAASVAATHKRYVVVPSDDHGTPAVAATHSAPTAPDADFDLSEGPERGPFAERLVERRRSAEREAERATSAIDYYAFWKLADVLIELAESGADEPFSAASERLIAYMGAWSDGREVRKLELYSRLPAIGTLLDGARESARSAPFVPLREHLATAERLRK
jgi:pimeloyl-ACP methyl ester carboxylesterase